MVDVASLITYAADRGTTVADEPATEQALVRASDYVTFNYIVRFMAGYDEASENVDAATYEAALLELATPGFFSKTFTPAEQKVLTEVKGIKWTLIGNASGVDAAAPVSTKIEAMLRPYLDRGAGVFVA